MDILNKSLPELMRAAVVTRYGDPDVIEIMEVPLPALKSNTIMVRVAASAVNSADARTRGGGAMIHNITPMDPERIQLSVCWVALVLIYLLGDVLRLYEKGREAAMIDGKPMTQTHLLMAAFLMLIPILLAIGMVFLPKGIAKWSGIIGSVILFLINVVGVTGYTGLFDRVLILLSLAMNVFTVVWTWLW